LLIWAPSWLVAFAVMVAVSPDFTVVTLAEHVTEGGVNGLIVKLVEQLAELFFFHFGSVIVAFAV
jgi:hypothetical protein